MRSLLPLLLLTLVSAAAYGQQQEKMVDRLLKKPDESKVFDLRQGAFGMNQSFDAKGVPVKGFVADKSFSTRSFASKSFVTQDAAMAHSQFATKDANTKGRYEIPNIDKTPVMKAVAVNDATEAGKTAEIRTAQEARRGEAPSSRFLQLGAQPANQPHDLAYDGDLKPMSIDDIRTLLNKNK